MEVNLPNYIGLNLSHDASVSLLNDKGQVLFALAEERVSRIKGFTGWPALSIQTLVEDFPSLKDDKELVIVIGSHSYFKKEDLSTWRLNLFLDVNNYFDAINDPVPPGWMQKNCDPRLMNLKSNNLKEVCTQIISEKLHIAGLTKFRIEFSNHHDSHLASAFFASGFKKALVLSLDSQGDRESGAISVYESGSQPERLARFRVYNSIGFLYSAVTRRYGFKESRHEGKITGLSASGSSEKWLKKYDEWVVVKQGVPRIKLINQSILIHFIIYLLRKAGFALRPNAQFVIDDVADNSSNFGDLANFIQNITEKTVLQILKFWKKTNDINYICLAGGVFSNVLVNQRIQQTFKDSKVFIYPNMGDGGISIGCVWDYMMRQSIPISLQDEIVYLNSGKPTPINESTLRVLENEISSEDLAILMVKDIQEDKIIGIFDDPMEWGPRALGKRSIIAQATDRNINFELNKRLKRTEFMPFAPIIQQELFHEVFDWDSFDYEKPFKFMTMTVNVKDNWKTRIPAVTHIDGTARPQIIDFENNKVVWNLLDKYFKSTGIPCLVNTSFNVHEEPIVYSLENAFSALDKKMIDVLFCFFEKKWYRISN